MAGKGILAAIIADDLTGAMDSAAPFANRGLDVLVLTTPDIQENIPATLPQVISVNTNTRHQSGADGARIVGRVAAELLKLDPALMIKKIDSTLRGNVVSETVAAMQSAKRPEVVLCPAVPAQGRTVSKGEVFIDSVLLRDTAIGRDLRSPPPGAPLPDLFKAADPSLTVKMAVPCSSGQSENTTGKKTLHIPDAQCRDDLLELTRLVQPRHQHILFVGASGITEALAETLYGAARPTKPADQKTKQNTETSGLSLFVVGSLASQATAQVETLIREYPDARILEPGENRNDNINALQSLTESTGDLSFSLVIRPPVKSRESGKSNVDSDYIVRELADCAAVLMEQVKVGMLLATGGDTAAALIDRLGLHVITISGEVQPGVVYGLIDTVHGQLRLLTKAGGFGDNRLFCTINEYFK